MHEVLVNRLGGLSLPRKSVVRLTDRPDMTLDVYRGRKTTIQPTNIFLENLFCRVYESVQKVQDILLSSPAGVHLLTVCPKEAGIPITRSDYAFISVVNGTHRSNTVI